MNAASSAQASLPGKHSHGHGHRHGHNHNHNDSRNHSRTVAASVLASARRVEAARSPAAAVALARAWRHYEDEQWAPAFDALVPLAEQGDAAACKLALLMLRYGPAVYGAEFAAHPEQIARWAQRVLRASSRATASPSSMTASA